MPGFVIHAFVPTLAFLGMRRYFDPRIVLYLWPMTMLPDLDYFVGVHRATTLNLFFLAGVVILTHGLARAFTGPERDGSLERQRGVAARHFDRARAWMWTTTAAAYLGSHVLLDTFTGGFVPLYPLSDYTVCWFFYAEAVTATNDVSWYFEPCSHEGPPVVSEVYPVLDTDQAAMLAFLVVAWAAYAGAALWGRRRDGGPRAP